MDVTLYLGIDGGASRCRARLRDRSGNLLGEGVSGPANISADIELARASILEAAVNALRAAGLRREDIERCHAGLGLAGGGPKDLQDRLLDGWNPFATARLASDAYIAWLGAHGGGDGAVIILGTGSVCFGRIGSRSHVLGGWGGEISDEAGAAAIGRESLRRSIWAWDGRIAMTPLAGQLLSAFGGSPVPMAAAARTATPADYAAWAPLVFQFAEQGDELAAAILRDAAGHVVRMIECLQACGFSRIALMGGIAAPMTPWLPETLRACLCTARSDALDGAIMMAK
jgi:glucosamine kinase